MWSLNMNRTCTVVHLSLSVGVLVWLIKLVESDSCLPPLLAAPADSRGGLLSSLISWPPHCLHDVSLRHQASGTLCPSMSSTLNGRHTLASSPMRPCVHIYVFYVFMHPCLLCQTPWARWAPTWSQDLASGEEGMREVQQEVGGPEYQPWHSRRPPSDGGGQVSPEALCASAFLSFKQRCCLLCTENVIIWPWADNRLLTSKLSPLLFWTSFLLHIKGGG